MKKYWTGSHTKHRIQIHYVFIAKYRKRILRGKIVTRIYELFKDACNLNRWRIQEINIQVDHIHLLIQIKPDMSIAKVAQIQKGGSSRIIRKEYPELEEFLWGDSFWRDGYFAESVGQVEEEVIKKYIREQQDFHK